MFLKENIQFFSYANTHVIYKSFERSCFWLINQCLDIPTPSLSWYPLLSRFMIGAMMTESIMGKIFVELILTLRLSISINTMYLMGTVTGWECVNTHSRNHFTFLCKIVGLLWVKVVMGNRGMLYNMVYSSHHLCWVKGWGGVNRIK